MTELRPEDERLASRLDQAIPPGVSRTPRQTSDPLVNTALLLARLQVPPLSAEADARIQQRVLAAMRSQKTRSPWRAATYMRWLAAACLIVVVLTVGILPIAASSLPGDALYPVKRGLERIELLLATTAERQALVNLTQAERRLDEQTQLVERGQFDPALVTSALASMQASSEAAQASADPNLATTLQERSTSLTLRFAGLLEAASEHELPPPDPAAGVPPVEGADDGENGPELLSATPRPSRTPQPSPTPVPSATSPASTPGRPVMLPVPPGLSTRLAPAAGIISTQVADATATCERGRSCQSTGLVGGTPVPGGGQSANNGNGNGNTDGNANGNTNGNAGGNDNGNLIGNGNAGGANSGGSDNGNVGGNNGQTGGDAGSGNSGGASGGNSDGNSSGSNQGNSQGNSSGNGPPPDAGGGGQGNADGNNGNANSSSGDNGNGGGNSNGNNGNSNSGDNGGGNGNSNSNTGNSGNNGGGNGNSNGNSNNNSNNNDNGNNGNGNGNS